MDVDAVVIGAGPAGCAASIRLAQAGARVVSYLDSRSSRYKPGEIVDATIRVPLAELGLLEEFNTLDWLSLPGNVSLWDGFAAEEVEGIVNPYGYGVLLDRAEFDAWLRRTAISTGVEVRDAGQDLDIRPDGVGWKVRQAAKNTAALKTPVIIEATGRSGGVLGFGARNVTDNLIALLQYGSISTARKDQRLFIEATENGWWYAAPLPKSKAVIAFLTDADLLPVGAEARRAFTAAELDRTLLIRAFADSFAATGRALGYPANGSIRTRINGSNWVAIGDAAATYDPLSGQGIAAALAKGTAIARILTHGSDMLHMLNTYAEAERTAYASYLNTQRMTYGRAAPKFRSEFWARRIQK